MLLNSKDIKKQVTQMWKPNLDLNYLGYSELRNVLKKLFKTKNHKIALVKITINFI